jgi:3-methyladenine DNA glycosylase AlkD
VRSRASAILAELERLGSASTRRRMREQSGIVVDRSFGVPMSKMQALVKRHERAHALYLAPWETGWYEACTLCAFLDEPGRVTPAQMDRQASAFGNWGICDSLCFHLYDKTPHAARESRQWSMASGEHRRRAALALLESVALHDRQADDP